MQADNLGTKDKIAVLITKEPIDYNTMNKRIDKANGKSFQEKVENAMAGNFDTNVRFSGANTIKFEGSASKTKGIIFVIGVNK